MGNVFWGVYANLGAVHISETLNKDPGRADTSPSLSIHGRTGWAFTDSGGLASMCSPQS